LYDWNGRDRAGIRPDNVETKTCVVLTHSHPAAVQFGYVIWPNASLARIERKRTQCDLIILSVVTVERGGWKGVEESGHTL